MMNNRGLTLIELMVVLVIISILVGVAGYSLRGQNDGLQGRESGKRDVC